MPTTINNLLTSVGLDKKRLKTVRWGQPLDSSSVGIYIISTSPDPDTNANLFDKAPIDDNILKFWINKVPTILVDKKPATLIDLRQRLNSFWLHDENIVYIGQTESKSGLKGRVRQYYNTEIGERKPHAGGHWIKTLKILNQLFVHYIPTQNPIPTEEKILRAFVSQVSKPTLDNLHDNTLPIPFANLELEKGTRKNHGVSKSKLGD